MASFCSPCEPVDGAGRGGKTEESRAADDGRQNTLAVRQGLSRAAKLQVSHGGRSRYK
jgi:hypothetical protein